MIVLFMGMKTGTDGDHLPSLRELEGIGEKVSQYLVQFVLVTYYGVGRMYAHSTG